MKEKILVVSAPQDYRPFRHSILSPDEVRNLSLLRPWRAVVDTVISWLIIVAAWCAVALLPVWWLIGAAMIIVGTTYYSIAIVGHDGLHRRLFSSPTMNDLFNDLFCVGPLGAVTKLNRSNHMEHHRITARLEDPDRHKYLHEHKEPTFPFLIFLTGFANVWPTARNVFRINAQGSGLQECESPRLSSVSHSYGARDIAIIAGWQIALISGLSYFIAWWAYPLLWLFPVYFFAYRADLVRVFCEHSMLTSDVEADRRRRMVHFESNWLERRFFAPNNMNCHVAHHLWPGIPYYNLPEAERRVIAWAARYDLSGDIEIRGSYVSYLIRYFRWRLSQPIKFESTTRAT